MKRRRIVRIQIFLLVAVIVLILVRVFRGPAAPDGLVVFTQLSPGELAEASFVLEQPTVLSINAAGSYDSETLAPELAAYPWILNHETRAVVWQLDPGTQSRETSTLIKTEETLTLEAGTYDVFFTTHGHTSDSRRHNENLRSIFGMDGHWENDQAQWQFILTPLNLERNDVAYQREVDREEMRLPHTAGQIWSTAGMRGKTMDSYLFEVQLPTQLHIYAVGELCEEACDWGWIENVLTGARIWEMTKDNTELAGGMRENRRFEGNLRLLPGVYRAVFKTDRGHHFGSWVANPPTDPAAWGMTLRTADPTDTDAIAAFDPWTRHEQIMGLTQVTNEAHRRVQFAVEQPVRVIAYAVGEVSGGSRYDYGWLEHNDTEKKVWEMSWERSQPAGGRESNRMEVAFLNLKPGRYTLHYQTDGSHAYGSFSDDAPEHPDRWGVTLFAMQDASAIRLVLPGQPGAPPDAPPAPIPVPPLGAGELLIEKTRLGNEADIKVPLRLQETSRLHVYAVGEISQNGRYDYGWIEREDTGQIIWEMSLQNTEPAGGKGENRQYNGLLELSAGTYLVRYKTDFSHAFGDFKGHGPNDSEAWGITIERIRMPVGAVGRAPRAGTGVTATGTAQATATAGATAGGVATAGAPEVFVLVEQMPEPIGGLRRIQQQLEYPPQAREAGVEGRVIVQFIVDPEGQVLEPEVVRGIGRGCDEEALRLIREARFTPGRQGGEAVHVRMSLPVVFRIR